MTGPRYGARLARRCIALGLHLAGGRAEQIAPGQTSSPDLWNGVVISGGIDLHPQSYGQCPEAGRRYERARDAFEFSVFDDALARGIPIMGICRGAQLVNVRRGGTLHQDVRGMRRLTSSRPTPLAWKSLRLHRGTRLHGILNADNIRINSLHRQGIDRLGEGVEVCGHDIDDIVQAIEIRDAQWCIGVQWHPEYLLYRRAHRRLFRALVAAARTAAS